MSYPGPGRWRGVKGRGHVGTPGVATQLAWTTQPAGAVTGIALTQQPVITIQDAFGTTVSATTTITLAITSGAGVLGGTVAVAAVAGVVTYTDILITGVGTDQLTATGGGLTSPQSNPIVVGSGIGDRLLMETGSYLLLESGSFMLMEV